MKTKTLALFILLFTNLSFFSCNDDDTSQTKLTNENNLYEGDLYSWYLDDEIIKTQTNINTLQDIIENKQGTQETQMQLDEAIAYLETLNLSADTQEKTAITINRVPRRPRPIPPTPCISGTCYPIPALDLIHLTITSDIENISVIIRDAQTQTIVTSVSTNENQFAQIDEFNSLVSAAKLNLNGYVGLANIEVTRISNNNASTSYNMMVNFY